jgi:LmbE family N-acetylglucosaminyl deacetylase
MDLNRLRTLTATLAFVAVLLLAAGAGRAGAAEPLSCTGRTIATVAHEDDSLLFMSPRLQSEIDSGRCVRTVFVTAGDAGRPAEYWEGREAGVEAAYAEMAGVANAWTTGSVASDGHTLRLRTLSADPRVSIVFMRLPDGGSGEGFPLYGNQSIVKLWYWAHPCGGCSSATEVEAVDDSARYTYGELVQTLAGLIGEFGPTQIWTQDYVEDIHATDHPDHVVTGLFTREAAALDSASHKLLSVWDYFIQTMPENVFGQARVRKQQAYYTYAAFDPLTCHTEIECDVGPFAEYGRWLRREYVRDERTHGVVANAGYAQIVTAGQAVTLDGSASSTESGATPTYEWAQTGGPTVTLSDPAAAQPTFTMLGHPTLLTFRLTAKDGSTTSPPDYVEVRVPSATPDPTAVVATGATVDSGATVRLDGSESWDPNSLPLTYEWTQTAGPEVTLAEGTSAQPEFVAPTGPATLKLALVVSNGTQRSEAATVTFQVKGIAPSPTPNPTPTPTPGPTPNPGPQATGPVLAGPTVAFGFVGRRLDLSIEASGAPEPAISVDGRLPAGLALKLDGAGRARLVGKPRRRGVHHVTLSARNSAGTAVRRIRLVLEPLPTLSARALTLRAGAAVARGVKVAGGRIESVRCSGGLPAGTRCRVRGRRIVVTGSPAAAALGTYHLSLRIKARAGIVVRPLTVRIVRAR